MRWSRLESIGSLIAFIAKYLGALEGIVLVARVCSTGINNGHAKNFTALISMCVRANLKNLTPAYMHMDPLCIDNPCEHEHTKYGIHKERERERKRENGRCVHYTVSNQGNSVGSYARRQTTIDNSKAIDESEFEYFQDQ